MPLATRCHGMSEPNNHVCEVCGQTFPNEASLEAHVRTVGLVD